jgi:hypothetical protein
MEPPTRRLFSSNLLMRKRSTRPVSTEEIVLHQSRIHRMKTRRKRKAIAAYFVVLSAHPNPLTLKYLRFASTELDWPRHFVIATTVLAMSATDTPCRSTSYSSKKWSQISHVSSAELPYLCQRDTIKCCVVLDLL